MNPLQGKNKFQLCPNGILTTKEPDSRITRRHFTSTCRARTQRPTKIVKLPRNVRYWKAIIFSTFPITSLIADPSSEPFNSKSCSMQFISSCSSSVNLAFMVAADVWSWIVWSFYTKTFVSDASSVLSRYSNFTFIWSQI